MNVLSETVEVKINLPKKLFDALKWYVPQTEFEVAGNVEKSLDAWIVETVKQDLECEINAGCEGAADQITEKLKLMLDLKE